MRGCLWTGTHITLPQMHTGYQGWWAVAQLNHLVSRLRDRMVRQRPGMLQVLFIPLSYSLQRWLLQGLVGTILAQPNRQWPTASPTVLSPHQVNTRLTTSHVVELSVCLFVQLSSVLGQRSIHPLLLTFPTAHSTAADHTVSPHSLTSSTTLNMVRHYLHIW